MTNTVTDLDLLRAIGGSVDNMKDRFYTVTFEGLSDCCPPEIKNVNDAAEWWLTKTDSGKLAVVEFLEETKEYGYGMMVDFMDSSDFIILKKREGEGEQIFSWRDNGNIRAEREENVQRFKTKDEARLQAALWLVEQMKGGNDA